MKLEVEIADVILRGAATEILSESFGRAKGYGAPAGRALVQEAVERVLVGPELAALLEAEVRRQLPVVVVDVVGAEIRAELKRRTAAMRRAGTLFPTEARKLDDAGGPYGPCEGVGDP